MTAPSRIYRAYPRSSWSFFAAALLLLFPAPPLRSAQQVSSPPSQGAPTPSPLFKRVIANQEQSEKLLDEYERVMRSEVRKPGGDPKNVDIKVWRVFPTGAAVDKIPLSLEEKPLSAEAYQNDLEKLENYLVWLAQNGSGQKEAYAKAERRRKERFDLLEATYQAFIFTPDGQELREGRTLLRYTMTPNPKYKPTSRNATIFTRVRGTIWIDEQSSQLAKIDGTVTEDISLALFLAKVYKGSHFMQERYEVAPGLWEPSFEQYDFDGRKFFSSVSIHERNFYSSYKRVGPPQESIDVVRADLSKVRAQASDH